MADAAVLIPILAAAFIASASPGPATLAIAREAMSSGRRAGVTLALGVTTGSWMWSIGAASGLSVVLLANAWVLDLLRVLAAGYLLWLAWRAACSALVPADVPAAPLPTRRVSSYFRGVLLHVTNPKAIVFFAALYALALPVDATPLDLVVVVLAVGVQSLLIFTFFAFAFSHSAIASGYLRLRRLIESVCAVIFGSAAIGLLATSLSPIITAARRDGG